MTLRGLASEVREGVGNRLPARWAAKLDLRRPSLASPWGGPMNGQQGRQAIVRELCRAAKFDAVIETGTFRGTTTQFLADVSGVVVYSIESSERLYLYSVERLRDRNVQLIHGDSSSALGELVSALPAREAYLFYLDAHWGPDLPLSTELTTIRESWPAAVIMIDDFQVPFDDGYGFDDYGPGKALTESLFEEIPLPGWLLCYPAVDSRAETGARRGSAVLLGPASAIDGHSLTTLRASRLL